MSDSSFRDAVAEERTRPDSAAPHVGADGVDTGTAGSLLRRARETAGLQIAELALELKVPVKKLEALEQDRLDVFASDVFARALAGSVCRSLKVDATPVLARLPPSRAPGLGAFHYPQSMQFPGAGGRLAHPVFPAASRTAWIAGGVLVAGALGLFLWSFIRKPADSASVENKTAVEFFPGNTGSGASGFVPETVSGVRSDAFSAASATDHLNRQAELANALSLTGSFVAESARDRQGQPGTTPNVSATAAESMPAASPHESVAGSALTSAPVSGILALKADGESWVQVTDARGVVLLSRTLEAGDSVATSGVLPMEAVLGRADVVRVEVRGKEFDVASMTRDNVARFKVR